MKSNMPWEQLAGFFAGELTREEHQKMKSWIIADPQREQKVRRLHKIWRESGVPPYRLNVDEAWERLSGNMDQLEQKTAAFGQEVVGRRANHVSAKTILKYPRHRRSGSVKRLLVTTLTTAAVILIAILFVYQVDHSLEDQKVTKGYTAQEFTTQQGERATYVLADDSRVILHPGSRLEVPARFNVENRELYLEGEAYFEVTPDAENPFIVNTEHAYTCVLGTTFLVQAWSGLEKGVEVVVSEGKVAFGAQRPAGSDDVDKKELIITRNQKGLLTGDKGPVVSEVDDLEWYFGWTEGRLVFDNRPLSEIIPRLEYWYAVEIQLEEPSLGTKKITGDIDNSQPMGEVLKGMAMSLDIEFELENRTVTFRQKE